MQTQASLREAPPAGLLPEWKASHGSRPLAGLTVLLVEDSRFASEAVRLLCLRSGARIRRADCLTSAQRHLATYRPAVAMVDMGLPDGDGADLIAALAALRPRVPVILGISGDPQTRAAALAAGASGFLHKPIESLAVFQQAILTALPADARPLGPRVLPTDVVLPDVGALRDDLAHVAAALEGAPMAGELAFIARFVGGLACASRDTALAAAARAVLASEAPMHGPALGRLREMIDRRLCEIEAL